MKERIHRGAAIADTVASSTSGIELLARRTTLAHIRLTALAEPPSEVAAPSLSTLEGKNISGETSLYSCLYSCF